MILIMTFVLKMNYYICDQYKAFLYGLPCRYYVYICFYKGIQNNANSNGPLDHLNIVQ